MALGTVHISAMLLSNQQCHYRQAEGTSATLHHNSFSQFHVYFSHQLTTRLSRLPINTTVYLEYVPDYF